MESIVIICFIFFLQTIFTSTLCPQDWEKIPELKICIKQTPNSYYKADFDMANNKCKDEGGKLLDIRNQIEFNTLKTHFQIGIGGGIPIALHRVNGTWLNGDGTKNTFALWADGEPKTFNECAYLHTDKAYPASEIDYKWKSSDCSFRGGVDYPNIVCYKKYS